jgi:hypothetical protein
MIDFPGDPFAPPKAARPELIKNGRYYLPPIDNPTGKPVARSRVTTFVKAVSDTWALNRWQQWQMLVGLLQREDLYDLLRTLPTDDKDGILEIADRAMEAAKSNRVGFTYGEGGNETGTALHAYTDQVDRGELVTARSIWAPKLENYTKALRDAALEVMFIECRVVIERFGLAGTFDRVLAYANPSSTVNPLFIGDLKTQKKFYTWWEIAMQLALYAHADAMWDPEKWCYIDMPPVSWDIAIVAHMPMVHDGDDPDRVQLYEVDIAEGWKACQLVSDVRTLRSAGRRWGRPLGTLSGSLSAIERYALRLRDAASQGDLTTLGAEMFEYFRGKIPSELRDIGSKRWNELA